MTRPARRILIIDADEYRLSRTRLVLECHGYRVTDERPDVILGFWPAGEQFIKTKQRMMHIPAVLVAPKDAIPADSMVPCWCDRIVQMPPLVMADLLETIKFVLARKRGPVKGMQVYDSTRCPVTGKFIKRGPKPANPQPAQEVCA